MISHTKTISMQCVVLSASFFFFLLSGKSNSLSENLRIKLNCEDNICKCQSTENFNVDSVIHYLKHYKVQDTVRLACAYHQLAIGYFYYEDNEAKAIQFSNKAINLRKQFNDGWLWKSQLNLSNYYSYTDQYDESIKYAEKAKDQIGYPKRPKDSLLIFRLLAEGYYEIGELSKAKQFAEKAITINTKKKKIREALLTYATVLVSTKDSLNVKKGIEYLDSLEKFYLNEEDIFNLSAVKTELGKAFYFLKQHHKSIRYYEEALKLFETDIPNKAILSGNLGSTFTKQAKFEYAHKYLTQSLHLNETLYTSNYIYMYASNFENFGDFYVEKKQFDTALLHYQKSLNNLTNNFRTEDIHQNPNPKDTTLFIYSNPDIIRVLHLKATAAYQFYQQNKQEKYLNLANQTYQTAFNFHDKLQKDISTENSRLFQAKNIVPYIENALKITYQQQENTVLLQSMNEADALQFANLPDSLLAQEQDLKIAISFHTKQLNEAMSELSPSGGGSKGGGNEGSKGGGTEIKRLEKILFEEKQQYTKLINNLENNYPKYYKLKYQQNLTQLADVQKSLDDETALLEYFVGDSSIYILSILKDQSKLHKIEKPKNWSQTIDNFLNTIKPKEVMKDEYTEKLFEAFTQNSYALYQNLLQQPLADLNESITNIKIIPDAELNYIPFDLLLIKPPKTLQVDYKDLPYILKKKSLSYGYSAALLLENINKTRQTFTYDYAGFAPQYKNTDYDNLPFAKKNVQQVAKLLKGKIYLKSEAADKNFKDDIAQFKTFQLAMHGVLNDDSPLSSKMVFANNGMKDFELHAYELYNMKIPAELGVLSACETGSGKQAKGEGIMSLSRAFTYAGCNSLVMSLWSIEDEATADIVYNFFKYLKKGKTKDEALRQAKLDFLNDPAHLKTHPVYWAGLVQSGDTSPIDFGGHNFWWLVPLILIGSGFGIKKLVLT